MEIKFDVYFKKNLGTLFKSNEVDLNGKHAHVNMPLALVDRMEVNYLINGNKKYTDDVLITDITENLIQIPFKSDVLKVGEVITAKVVDFNEEERKISLSIKAIEAPAKEETVEE